MDQLVDVAEAVDSVEAAVVDSAEEVEEVVIVEVSQNYI